MHFLQHTDPSVLHPPETPLTLAASLFTILFLHFCTDPVIHFPHFPLLHPLLSHRLVGFTATVLPFSSFRFPPTPRSIGFGAVLHGYPVQ
ncbi:unnamed protein product [Citrullus colocynthis]|uniref:Uncharacterized protein n=1 Tax=Citrullus colocynthis TaxID=252529 RepID=A0ABP0YDF5_9ROSI